MKGEEEKNPFGEQIDFKSSALQSEARAQEQQRVVSTLYFR